MTRTPDVDLAIRGGLVVTQDDARRVLRADVGITGERIVTVGDVGAAERDIDATHHLVMPGLVNLHTHAAMTLLRGYGDDLPLEEWLRERIWPVEARLTADDVDAGSRLALAEMVAGGTTTFNDMYFWPDVTARAAEDVGVRAFVGVPMLDHPTPEMQPAEMPDAAARLLKRWRGHALVTPTVAVHAAYTAGPDTLDAAARLCHEHDALLHTHLHETRHEVYDVEARYGRRPLDQFAHHDALRRGVYAHGGWLTKAELARCAGAHAAIAHCPVSNMKLGTGGWLALPELWDAGGLAGLGTDGAASNNGLDLFETMKITALLQKQHRWDPTAAPARKVLDMATRDGAAALGLDAGTLAAGKLADVVLVGLDAPHLTPLHDAVSHLVYAARASDVTHTIVGGRVVYEAGTHRTLDVGWVCRRAGEAASRLVASVWSGS